MEIFQKVSINDQVHMRKKQFTYWLTVSVKRHGLDFCKKSLLNDQYVLSFFQILEG